MIQPTPLLLFLIVVISVLPCCHTLKVICRLVLHRAGRRPRALLVYIRVIDADGQVSYVTATNAGVIVQSQVADHTELAQHNGVVQVTCGRGGTR